MKRDENKRQPADIGKARQALYTLIKGTASLHVPPEHDDPDFLISDALDELESFRKSQTDIASVIRERERQNRKWGEQNHPPVFWLGILGEEFEELCQAVNETVFNNGPVEQLKGGYENMRAEAVQVAAVAVAFVEMLDRNFGRGGNDNATTCTDDKTATDRAGYILGNSDDDAS